MINSTFSNISRYTARNRFEILEPMLSKIIQNNKIELVLDVGVSTGETSVDLLRILPSNIKLYIADPYSVLYMRKFFIFNIYFDCDSNLKGLDVMGFPIKMLYKSKILTYFSKLLYYFFKSAKLGFRFKKIFSLNKDVVKLIDEGSMIWFDFDLFKPSDAGVKFDFIRVMNVLNHELFTRIEFQCAIKNICDILNPNGFIFIGRSIKTSPSEFKVSVLQLVDGKLIHYSELNGGADFKEHIVL